MPNATELYQDGLTYEEAGYYINALLQYVNALAFDKKLTVVYNKIGKILYNNYNKYLEALHCFTAIKNLPEMEKCFQKLDEIYPNSAYIEDIKGDCYATSDLILKAQECYYEALKITEDTEFKFGIYYKVTNLSEQHYNEFDINYIYNAVYELYKIDLSYELDYF